MFHHNSIIPWGSFWGRQEEKWGSFRGRDHFGGCTVIFTSPKKIFHGPQEFIRNLHVKHLHVKNSLARSQNPLAPGCRTRLSLHAVRPTVLSNGKGHFGPIDRNDKTGQSGPPSKLVPNIPVGPKRISPFHLMYQPNSPEFWVEWKAPLDSGFHAVDSGSQIIDCRLHVGGIRIPDTHRWPDSALG